MSWANAKRYTIKLKAQDKAGNFNNTYAVGTTSVTIIFDSAKPNSSVTEPAEGIYYSTPVIAGDFNMKGSCSDPNSPNNSGIEGSVQGAVKVRLLRIISGTTDYWDGSAWKVWYATYPFINGPTTDAGGANWTWLFLADNLTLDGKYTIETQSQDRAVPSPNYESLGSTRTFYG